MSNSLVEIDGGVEVRIFIGAPIEAVIDAINDLTLELNLAGESNQEKLDSVIQTTKSWWFSHIVSAKNKQIEQAAQQVADNVKQQLTTQLDNSPLRGA